MPEKTITITARIHLHYFKCKAQILQILHIQYSTCFFKPTGISSHQAFIMLKQFFKMDYFESLQGRAPPSLLASCGLVPFVRSCRGWKYLASLCSLLRKMFNILVQNAIRELFTMVTITISVQNRQKTKSLTTEITK